MTAARNLIAIIVFVIVLFVAIAHAKSDAAVGKLAVSSSAPTSGVTDVVSNPAFGSRLVSDPDMSGASAEGNDAGSGAEVSSPAKTQEGE